MVAPPTSPSPRSATGPSLSPLGGGEGLLSRVRMPEDGINVSEAYLGGSSLGLFEVDQDRVGGEEGDHDRQEINDVAQIDHAPRDRAEMAEKAPLRDPVEQPFRRPALKY